MLSNPIEIGTAADLVCLTQEGTQHNKLTNDVTIP